MNAEKLQEKLSDWHPEAGRQSWSLADDGWALHLTSDRHDLLASLVWELTLTRMGDAGVLTLQQWADQIAMSASGLMEDLKVIEIDSQRHEALLRSEAPNRRGPLASYYELRLYGLNKATLCRFSADVKEGTPRQQVAYAVTHETLANLIEDITC